MKKTVAVAPGKINIEEVVIPVPSPGEVLIKVKMLGICGSDIHIFEGHMGDGVFPVVQGHEMSGEIVDANGSTEFQNGDKVVVMPHTFCGECDICRAGRNNQCHEVKIVGVQTDGMAQEYVCFPERMVLKLPDDMEFNVAAMIEPLSVSVHACSLAGDLAGKNVLVAGAGVIGNLVAQVAQDKGANVMIAGRTESRLDFARRVGIKSVVNDSKNDLTSEVAKLFGPAGADIVFECIGVETSINESIHQCRKDGTVVILGIFGEKTPVDLFMLQDKELRVIGSMMFNINDFKESIKLAYEEKVQLKPLMTGVFPLEDFSKAYEAIEKKTFPIMKVLIQVEQKDTAN